MPKIALRARAPMASTKDIFLILILFFIFRTQGKRQNKTKIKIENKIRKGLKLTPLAPARMRILFPISLKFLLHDSFLSSLK